PSYDDQRVVRKRSEEVDTLRNAIVVFTVIHQQAESHVSVLKAKEWECDRTHVSQLDVNNGDQRTAVKIPDAYARWNFARDFLHGYRKIYETHVVQFSAVLDRHSFQYAHNSMLKCTTYIHPAAPSCRSRNQPTVHLCESLRCLTRPMWR